MKRNLTGIFIIGAWVALGNLSLPVVSAENQYDIKEMTPEVKTALENRKNRFEDLRQLKSERIVGENNRGYVEALSDDAAAKALVNAENQDRKAIYKTIEEQNNLIDALGTIEKVFADVQRGKASPGDKIQDESGSWVTK